jgi:hypothetical protein
MENDIIPSESKIHVSIRESFRELRGCQIIQGFGEN